MRVAVLGGGAAGLTAAQELLRLGHQVLLFERSDHLGGQLRTVTIEGTPLECFYHHIFTNDTIIAGLIDELGLGEKLRWVPSRVGFFTDGKVWDFVTPADLLRFQPLPLVDRVRLGLAGVYLQRQADWRAFEGYTAEAWLKRWAGENAYRVVWEPLLYGKFGDAASSIGMAWFQWKIRLRFGSRRGVATEYLGYLEGSFGQVWDTLAKRIAEMDGHVYTSAQVNRVRISDGRASGVEVPFAETAAVSGAIASGLARQEADAVFFPADAVIGAVPSPVLLRLAPELPDSYSQLLRGNRYQAVMCMILVLKRPLTGIYWLNITDRQMPFVAVIEHTNLMRPEDYGGKHVVYLSNYISREAPLYQASDEAVFSSYLPHLSRINPAFKPEWIEDWRLFREDAAQPIITTHYSRKIPPLATPITGLYMANNTQVYPEDRGQNYSVRIGREVARLAAGQK